MVGEKDLRLAFASVPEDLFKPTGVWLRHKGGPDMSTVDLAKPHVLGQGTE